MHEALNLIAGILGGFGGYGGYRVSPGPVIVNRPEPVESNAGFVALQQRLDRLTLVCVAMWSLMKEKTNVTEQELLDRVKEIDLMDGKADGKIGKQLSNCPKCGRVMSSRHQKCLYCGAENLQLGEFGGV